MKTKEFIAGLCAGLIIGVCLTIALAHNYKVIAPNDGPLFRVNTLTGKTWTYAGDGWRAMRESHLMDR
jgi:hypothetical protein